MNSLQLLCVVLLLEAIVAAPPSTSVGLKDKGEPEVQLRISEPGASQTTAPTDKGITEDLETSSSTPIKNEEEELPNVSVLTEKSCQCYIDGPSKDKIANCPSEDKKNTDEYKKNKKLCEIIMKYLKENEVTTTEAPVSSTKYPDTTEESSLQDIITKICPKYINKTESDSTIAEKDLKIVCVIIERVLEKESIPKTPTPTESTEKPESSKQEAPQKSYSLGTVLGWSFGAVFIGVGAAMGGFLLCKRYRTPA